VNSKNTNLSILPPSLALHTMQLSHLAFQYHNILADLVHECQIINFKFLGSMLGFLILKISIINNKIIVRYSYFKLFELHA